MLHHPPAFTFLLFISHPVTNIPDKFHNHTVEKFERERST